jgi:hypothetical protein
MNSNDNKLSALLRQARRSPTLPPGFQQDVWRRVEDAAATVPAESWLDALAALILRPRFAFAAAAVLLLAGAAFGTHDGLQAARHESQANYLAVVAPDSLR